LSFGGAVLLVSHDRALLDAVGTRTFALEDGRLRSYEGGWAEYSRVREERSQAEAEAHERARSEKTARRRSNCADHRGRREPPAGPSKNQQRRIAELERDVERAERELAALEDELADPSQWLSPTSRERSAERHAEARRAVERAYAAWEDATR
jgi:ATP-binding cassette, subfamily F, member 3